jgi:hypothetical protein
MKEKTRILCHVFTDSEMNDLFRTVTPNYHNNWNPKLGDLRSSDATKLGLTYLTIVQLNTMPYKKLTKKQIADAWNSAKNTPLRGLFQYISENSYYVEVPEFVPDNIAKWAIEHGKIK